MPFEGIKYPMKKILFSFLLVAFSFGLMAQENIYDFKMRTIDGDTVSLSDYKGQVILIVNVASRCGFTPQYEALEKLYEEYKDRGFVILAFPANDFMNQEPGSDEEIKNFCRSKYGVSFPVFSKIHVRGPEMHPLYQYLTEMSGKPVKWNFQKYLIDRNGNIVKVFAPKVKPDSPEIKDEIESILA